MGYSLTMKDYLVLDLVTNSTDYFQDVIFKNEAFSSVSIIGHPMVKEPDVVLNPGIGEDQIEEGDPRSSGIQFNKIFVHNDALLDEEISVLDQHSAEASK